MTSIESILDRQFRRWENEIKERRESADRATPPAKIITISREKGSRGSFLGQIVAGKLRFQLLHRDIIDAVCASSGYYRRLIESLDDHVRSDLSVAVESMIAGQSVDYSDYIEHLHRVMLSMSELGGVVVIGRGGNFILGPNRGFHLRVVAPIDNRIENLCAYRHMSRTEAEKQVHRYDDERRHFAKHVFGRNIDDPHFYDLVVNTALTDIDTLANLVMQAYNAKVSVLSTHHALAHQ
ncbi:MAG: cytidylate kinase-like family protein [Candidatus Zixiibacteriota bacterium]